MKIRELHLKNEKKDPSREGWVYFNKPGKGLSIYRWPSRDEYPEIDHLILEDDSGKKYKCTIDKNLWLHKECIGIPVESTRIGWKIDTNKAFGKHECECDEEPKCFNPFADYRHDTVFEWKLPKFRENPKKKEFTYKPEWNCYLNSLDPSCPRIEVAGIKVCDKMFDIKKGMSASDVIYLFESVYTHIKNEMGYDYGRIFTYSKGCPRYYVTIHNDDVDYTHHVTPNMDPKDILDIMMKACERIEKYIKEGK